MEKGSHARRRPTESESDGHPLSYQSLGTLGSRRHGFGLERRLHIILHARYCWSQRGKGVANNKGYDGARLVEIRV